MSPDVRKLGDRVPFAEVCDGGVLHDWLAEPEVGREEIRSLIRAHGLVVFRDTSLTPREELQVAQLAGYHATEQATGGAGSLFGWQGKVAGLAALPDMPEVVCQGNVQLLDHHGIDGVQLTPLLTFENEGYHSDGMHNMQHSPPVLTSMRCVKAPLAGGETFFACSRLALSRLGPAMRALCRRITVHYVYDESLGLPIMRGGIVRESRQPREKDASPPAPPARTCHPLVRTHPETGEEALYLSCANIDFMVAPADEHDSPALRLDTAASYELVAALLGVVTRPPYVYAHRWREGDLALFDNRLTLHAPLVGSSCVGERLHQRVRLEGGAAANRDLAEHAVRRDLAAAHTLSHHFKFDELTWNHISARLPSGAGFLVTPGDALFDEVTPLNLSLSSPQAVNVTADVIHSAIYAARPDVRAIVHHHTPAVVAVSCLEGGLQLLTQDAGAFVDAVAYHGWEGVSDDYDEKARIAAALGPIAHTLLMRHHGAVTTGRTVAEAWVRYYYLDRMCEVQCRVGSAPHLQPPAASLAHACTQLGPGGPYSHGRFEWAALLRLAESLQAGKSRFVKSGDPVCGVDDLAVTAQPPMPPASASALHSLEESGFCVLEGVIPPRDVAVVRESILRTTERHHNPNAPACIGHVPGLIGFDQSLAPYLASPDIMRIVESLFGAAKVTFTTGQTNHPGAQRQAWHADWPFAQTGSAHLGAPYADATCHLTTLWMLDPMNEENGTILLPGSHRATTNPTAPGVLSDPTAALAQEVRATGKAGSVLVMDSRLWHAIPPNPTSTSRVAVAVRYAPWWLDTSVVMPGSAARRRIVDGAGRPDTGGIPLGNPAQPPVPPGVYAELAAAASSAERRTAALYEHWLPPTAEAPSPPLAPPAPGGVPQEEEAARAALGQDGLHVLRQARLGNGRAMTWDRFSVAEAAEGGYLDAPAVCTLARASLGEFVRISDVQAFAASGGGGRDGELSCAWPHDPALTPCVSTPPLARMCSDAVLALHVFVAHSECALLVRPLGRTRPERIALCAGDAAVIDSRVPFRWADGSDGCAIRVTYSPWWFDGSVLAVGSLQRRRAEVAFEAGLAPPLPPPRPPLSLDAVSASAQLWDLLQHWEVESGGGTLASVPDPLATYGRLWALQQLLQSGLFELVARALGASGPAGMGDKSFMAAKVRSDPRAAWVLPIFAGALYAPACVPLLLAAHAANVWLHASRAPFVWDHELWDLLTELLVMVAMVGHLVEGGSDGHHRVVARAAPAVRTALVVFYAAAAFWKLNDSFFDPRSSCAPVFTLQLVAEYIPPALAPPAVTNLVARASPWIAVLVEATIPLLLAQGSRPALRRCGLGLGLLFHLLIALTPPPNNAGGFSVGVVVRYLFFLPAATAAAERSLLRSLASMRGAAVGALADPRVLALIASVAAAVGVAGSQCRVTLQGALPVFIVLLLIYLQALRLSMRIREAGPRRAPACSPLTTLVDRVTRSSTAVVLALCATYAFALPVLGLQDMAACNMFANLHGPTAVVTGMNHFLVPTGLLQALYEHSSPAEAGPLAGGVVEVQGTTSRLIRDLYPAESTSMLSERSRALLAQAGHSAREFGPSTTRVVGVLPGMKPDSEAPQLPYLLPALELRRLLAEARARNESFELTYKRVSNTGAPFNGRLVHVVDSHVDGAWQSRCSARVPGVAGLSSLSGACAADELAVLPSPADGWLATLLLSFPLPMSPDGQRELGCLA